MSDDVFRGMHFEKNHFALCSKKNKTRKKSKSSLLFPLSLFFSLFSLKVSSQRKTSSHLSKSCSRFHHLKRKTHLSSLRAQFRAHTSSRAEERHPPLCCSLFLQYYYKECFERKEREKRARCLWLYCCVHRFDWRKKHAQVINESTSHLFFSFQKRISSRIPSTDDGRWHREKVSQVASWGRVRACDKNQKEEECRRGERRRRRSRRQRRT
jgi:hypothetical protein